MVHLMTEISVRYEIKIASKFRNSFIYALAVNVKSNFHFYLSSEVSISYSVSNIFFQTNFFKFDT